MSPWAVANLGMGLMSIEQMCKTIPREAPWEAEEAAEWDRMSIGDWLERNVLSRPAREMLDMVLGGTYTSTASEVSFLWML
ncbi:monoamine oxidase, partial [Mycobacterium kansasii]